MVFFLCFVFWLCASLNHWQAVGTNTCTVRIGDDEQDVAKSELKVVPPEVGDKCVVLGGTQHLGSVGELTAIDRTKDCLVNFVTTMAMIPLALLGKQSPY